METSRGHDPEPSQSELKPAKQVRRMHSVHSTGLSSSASITRRPLCSTSCARVLSPSLFSLLSFSPCYVLCLVLPFFHSRLFLLFRSTLQLGFFHEDLRFPQLAIIFLDAADDRNLARETRHRTIPRIVSTICSSQAFYV